MSAVTIQQEPTSPNGTMTDMIYVLSTTGSSAPQYSFICQIWDEGSSNLLTTLKQSPNNDGKAVFEVGRLLNNYIDYEIPFYINDGTPIVNSPNNNIREFDIKFGDESAPSISGSLTASIDKSTTKLVIPAVKERISEGFNWNSGSYDILSNSPSILDDSVSNLRANTENFTIVSPSSFSTISSLNGEGPKGDLDTIRYVFYGESMNTITTANFSNPYGTTNTEDKLVHIGTGPANIAALEPSVNNSAVSYYGVYLDYASGNSDQYMYKIDRCSPTPTTFAWINKLGVFDYYTATGTQRHLESMNRNVYNAPYINYSISGNSLDWSAQRRGETQYYAKFNERFEAETTWLTSGMSEWLFELFESPSAFVQIGDLFYGIILENVDETYRTNLRGQKTFKYTIKYRLSNPKRSRY